MQFFRDMAHNPFFASGLVAGLLASLACGVVGPYVITRRIVFLSGAIAHMAVAGVGASIWLAHILPAAAWFKPLYGATAVALLGAVVIGVVHERAAERTDTLIGALWAVGMALGILLIKFTPGYHAELMSYLFGNISIVSWEDVRLLVALDVVVLTVAVVFHKRLVAVSMDEQQAELQGVPVLATNLVLLCSIAMTVIALTQIVGLILVIALLTLPAATAGQHFGRLPAMMLASTGICAALTTLPRIAVYGTAISPESAIVLAAAFVYRSSTLVRK
jgi:zinc transport system permease protein